MPPFAPLTSRLYPPATEAGEWSHNEERSSYITHDTNTTNAASAPSPKWITFDPFSTKSYRLPSLATPQLPHQDATMTELIRLVEYSIDSSQTSLVSSTHDHEAEFSPRQPPPITTTSESSVSVTRAAGPGERSPTGSVSPSSNASLIDLYSHSSIQVLVDDKAIEMYNKRAAMHNLLVRLYGKRFCDPSTVTLPTLEEVFAELRCEGWNFKSGAWRWS